MKTRRLVLPLAALVLLVSCGHRGDPLPPLRKTPPAPTDFRVAQRGDALELEATAPAASIDGVAFDRLALEFLYGTGAIDIEKRGQKRLAQGAPGQRFGAALPLPAPGTLVRATVRAVSSGERGARTVTKALVVQPPLEPPRELRAGADDEGVRLSWEGVLPQAVEPPPVGPRLPGMPSVPVPRSQPESATAGGAAVSAAPAPTPTAPTPAAPPTAENASAPPAASSTPRPLTPGTSTATAATGEEAPAPARRNGFLVYRRIGEAPYAGPLGAEPLEQRSAVDADVPLGESVCYVVRAVASTDPRIESGPSNEACVVRRDTTAPAPPAGLATLPRPAGLEVLWSPSAEADLAGYRVYREAPGQPRRRLAELGPEKAGYLDETAVRGTSYRYTITAFDQSGNESSPSDPVEAAFP